MLTGPHRGVVNVGSTERVAASKLAKVSDWKNECVSRRPEPFWGAECRRKVQLKGKKGRLSICFR